MQFKSFMEALKGKQHKIDKNKNGQIDAHDFKLLRKEESEESAETIEESEERMARADYKVGASGRKSHKEIVFDDAESKDDEEDKKEMKEAKMSDADMAERERIVKGMKKNLAGFKSRYGERAKEVMYATATKQAMKEETVEEAAQKVNIPAYLRKQQGQTPLKLSDLKRKDTLSDKENLAKMRNEEAEELDELSKGTLGSYIKKAKGNLIGSAQVTGMGSSMTGQKTQDKAERKVQKRASGINKAVDRLTNEEAEELDEISKGTLGSYIKKAKGSLIGSAQVTGMGSSMTGQKTQDKAERNVQKRAGGINKAVDRLTKEEVEAIEEKSEQAKQNKIMKNMMDASRGARYKLNNPVPDAEPEHKTARAHNVAIGRAMRSEEKKDDVPFEGPYSKTPATAKDKSGAVHTPMSRAKHLARMAMKKQMKEDIDRLFEAKDEQEYGYEGDMAMNQLSTLTRCAEMIKDTLKPDTDLPEWVQSKITLATDYIVTAADYLHSELEEQAPVAPVPDRKYIKGTPEHKAYKATKKPINGMPTNVKEEVELDEVEHKTLSYTDFVATLLEYEPKGGRYVHKGTYGGSYSDPEGADDADDKKPKQQSAEKRGRGRPAGAKSGAGKITGTSKLYK